MTSGRVARGLEQKFAAKLVTRDYVGERQGQKAAEDYDQEAAHKGVPKGFAKKRAAKEIQEVDQGQVAGFIR